MTTDHDDYFMIRSIDGQRLDKPRVVQHKPQDRNATYTRHGPGDSAYPRQCPKCYPKQEPLIDNRKTS